MSRDPFTINPELEPWTVTVPLALSAHSWADQFRRYQVDPNKAKQVYLNTLAVYAVDVYLQRQGIETNLAESTSWDPTMQMLMDAADLVVANCGKLECRPVLPDAETVHVPPEVWDDRIGYIAVQLNQSLRQATLLGFVPTAKSEVPLSQLRSLAELPKHLNQVKPLVNLSQWLEGLFETGWQAVDALVRPEPELAFSFRNLSDAEVRRYKLVELGAGSGQSVAVMIAITSASEPEIEISVEVCPSDDQTHLPANLQLMVLDEAGEAVLDAQAGHDNQHMQLEFTGEPGDQFGIKVALGDVSVTERFVI
jgi:hypothetical protein